MTPDGRNGLEEVAANGVDFIRTGVESWSVEFADEQIAEQKQLLAAAHAHGLRCWLWLGQTPNLPARSPSPMEALLEKIVRPFRGDPALFAYKGIDEPRNPFRGDKWIRPAGMIRAYRKIKSLDADHPVVVVQAPRSPVAQLVPYRPSFDITGADIFPVSYPPGRHSDLPTKDVSVVGEIARKTRQAAGAKPYWLTLQIAWSGVIPTKSNPDNVPRFPTLQQQRFMAYQAIVNGVSGLVFFGGHVRSVMTPADAASGWNWTFWRRVLRPVVSELASPELQPALAAQNVAKGVTTANTGVELVTRRAAGHVYVIAVRKGGAVSRVRFSGLPRGVARGAVLFEYVQEPLPPPPGGTQVPRPLVARNGGFSDWLAPNDARVYRFAL